MQPTAAGANPGSRLLGSLNARDSEQIRRDHVDRRTDVYAAYMYDKISSQSSGDTFGVGIRAKF